MNMMKIIDEFHVQRKDTYLDILTNDFFSGLAARSSLGAAPTVAAVPIAFSKGAIVSCMAPSRSSAN